MTKARIVARRTGAAKLSRKLVFAVFFKQFLVPAPAAGLDGPRRGVTSLRCKLREALEAGLTRSWTRSKHKVTNAIQPGTRFRGLFGAR